MVGIRRASRERSETYAFFCCKTATLKISLSDVRLNPEGCLEDHRLPPCIVHAVDDFRRVAFFGEIRFHRNDNRRAKGEQVAGTNMTERVAIIRFILLAAMMAQPNFVLIVEPLLIVLGTRRVEHPLAEALSDRFCVIAINRVRLRIFIIGSKMRMIENDSTPRLLKGVDKLRPLPRTTPIFSTLPILPS